MKESTLRLNKIKPKNMRKIIQIKEKKNDSEVSIRKDENQHRNEGSFEEFIESEKKRRSARYRKHW